MATRRMARQLAMLYYRRTSSAQKEVLEAWKARLSDIGINRDFSDPEDRATFRSMVYEETKNNPVRMIAELARSLGAAKVPRSRDGAARALAEAWMKRGR